MDRIILIDENEQTFLSGRLVSSDVNDTCENCCQYQ